MRDTRTYIRLHDGMPDHPKIDGLSDKAFRLLIASWCWCSRHLTDGHIPPATWSKRGTSASRRELIEAGLVVASDDGVRMHDYLDHQRSAQEVADLQEKRREAGRKGGQAKAKPKANPQASAKQVLKQTGSKTEAETETETDTSGGEDGKPSAASFVAEWIEHCGERPPSRVVGHVSRELKGLVDDGIAPERIRAGLAEWHRKGLHPSTLASVVHETTQATFRPHIVKDPNDWMTDKSRWNNGGGDSA